MDEICHNLYDKNENYIEISKLASVYSSASELRGYFRRNTIFSPDEIEQLIQYIHEHIEGEDLGLFATAAARSKFEMSGGGAPICKITGSAVPLESKNPPRPGNQRKGRSELRQEARNNGQACCPKCGSTSLSANKKGFGIGKAVVGAWAVGPLGLIAGNAGAGKVVVTCLNCGHKWKM